MTPSEDLFKLIQSLTPNEKGYFKKFSKIHVREGKNNYMLLFEAIEKQDAYDEQALINKFRNEQFVKQFPVAKNYLYNLILKALDVYHSGVDLEIGYLIHCSIILTDKAMFEPALKFLKRAEVLAREHHKLSYMNKILNHELYILRRGATAKKMEMLDEHYRLRVENADQLRYVIEYQHLNDLMCEQFNRSFGIQRNEAIREAGRLIQLPLMKEMPAGLSLYAQIEFWSTYLHYYSICRNYEKAYEITSTLINEVLRKNEHILANQTKILIMQNHCTSCIDTGRLEEAVKTLERLRLVETTYNLERLTMFQFIYLQELIIHLKTGQYSESLKVIEKAEKEMLEFDDKMRGNPKGFLFYLAAFTHFANGNFKEAQKWVNLLLNSKLSDYRSDIVSSFKILELLIYYETDKNDIIHYKLDSFERALKKDRENYGFELMVLGGIRKLFQEQRVPEIAGQARNLKKEITDYIEKNSAASDAFYHFDLRDWLETKISLKPLSLVLASAQKHSAAAGL